MRSCLALAALLPLGACAPATTAPRPIPAGLFRPFVDNSPAWSADGRTIAFHRGYASSYGPPGVYLMPSQGGVPTLLTAGNLFYPEFLRFSPDGRSLIAEDAGSIVLISTTTGVTSTPFYTDNGPTYPDWSPDGRFIVHTRLFYQSFPPEAPDSAGLHVFDITTGDDHPMLDSSGVSIYGTWPRWSKDGTLIAFLRPTYNTTQVCTVHPDGTGLRVLTESAPNTLFNWLQWWNSPLGGPWVVYQDSGRQPRNTYAISPLTGVIRQWPIRLTPWDAFSPDGASILLLLPEPSDSLGVIFTARAEDPTGASRRQLTEWHRASL